MADQFDHIAELLLDYLKRSQDAPSENELRAWMAAHPDHQTMVDRLDEKGYLTEQLRELLRAESRTTAALQAQGVILIEDQKISEAPSSIGQSAHRVHLLKTTWLRQKWFRYAAAILILAGVSAYLWQTIYHPSSEIAQAKLNPGQAIPAPVSSHAILTLGNGRQISLDSATNGVVVSEGNTRIRKSDNGQIVYTPANSNSVLEYNTLTVPRGSRVVSIVLSDGSKVFLNAGSSLTYPVAFSDKERSVQITGEAYFEIEHRVSSPFIVGKKDNDLKVRVLGTRFNVNAYDDETAMRITLLDGAVKVSKGSESSILKPREQAEINGNNIRLVNNIDIDEVIAWKNGRFQFGDATDIGMVMRQISRWYDVDIEYQGNISGHIGGSMPRDVSASHLLKSLQKTGLIKFRIEGRKIIVMPPSY